MKQLAAAAALSVIAAGAQAGSLADPVVEMPVEVIIADAQASSAPSAGLVLGLTTLIIFGAALAN